MLLIMSWWFIIWVQQQRQLCKRQACHLTTTTTTIAVCNNNSRSRSTTGAGRRRACCCSSNRSSHLIIIITTTTTATASYFNPWWRHLILSVDHHSISNHSPTCCQPLISILQQVSSLRCHSVPHPQRGKIPFLTFVHRSHCENICIMDVWNTNTTTTTTLLELCGLEDDAFRREIVCCECFAQTEASRDIGNGVQIDGKKVLSMLCCCCSCKRSTWRNVFFKHCRSSRYWCYYIVGAASRTFTTTSIVISWCSCSSVRVNLDCCCVSHRKSTSVGG